MSADPAQSSLSEPVRTVLRLTVVGSLLVAVLYIFRPFLPSMLWSAFIVIAVWPGLVWLQNRFGWNRLACAFLLSLVLSGFVIGPLLGGIFTVAEHGEALFAEAKTAVDRIPDAPPAWVADLPLVGSGLAATWRDIASGNLNLRARLGPALQTGGRWLLGRLGVAGELVIQFLLVVVFSVIFYVHGEALADFSRRLAARIGGERAPQARDQARKAIRAVAFGVVLTALVQSTLALIGLLVADVPLAILLAFVCFLFAIAQLGAAWPLLAVAGWLHGWRDETGWALFMAIWGLFVVGGVDNIMRPILIKRGMSMPLTLVFLGVIGGLLSYGLIGVFLGPTLVAITYTLLLSWLAEPEAG